MLCFCFVAMGTKELRGPVFQHLPFVVLPFLRLPGLMETVTSRETLFLENGATECEEEEEGRNTDYTVGEPRKTLILGSDSLVLTQLSSIHQGTT